MRKSKMRVLEKHGAATEAVMGDGPPRLLGPLSALQAAAFRALQDAAQADLADLHALRQQAAQLEKRMQARGAEVLGAIVAELAPGENIPAARLRLVEDGGQLFFGVVDEPKGAGDGAGGQQ